MALLTTPEQVTDGDAIEATILTRRRFVRGVVAGGLAAATLAVETAFRGAEAARRKPPVKKRPTITSTNTGSNDTGSNGAGANAGNGTNSTGGNQTGANAGGDTVGNNVVAPPSQGGTNTGTSVTCTTRGEIVDANNPANNRPAERVCTTTP